MQIIINLEKKNAILLFIGLAFVVFAVSGVGQNVFHQAAEIVPGLFRSGNYTFNGSVGINTTEVIPLRIIGTGNKAVLIDNTSGTNAIEMGLDNGGGAPFLEISRNLSQAGKSWQILTDPSDSLTLSRPGTTANYLFSNSTLLATNTGGTAITVQNVGGNSPSVNIQGSGYPTLTFNGLTDTSNWIMQLQDSSGGGSGPFGPLLFTDQQNARKVMAVRNGTGGSNSFPALELNGSIMIHDGESNAGYNDGNNTVVLFTTVTTIAQDCVGRCNADMFGAQCLASLDAVTGATFSCSGSSAIGLRCVCVGLKFNSVI